jgi:hypothetical protein
MLFHYIYAVGTRTGNREDFEALERTLAGRNIPYVRESFRVPALPGISPSAGLALAACGGFLLSAGRPGASFLFALSGTLFLLLFSCGHTPLDWLGPKERRFALVVPGDATDGERTAVFLAVPLFCRRDGGGRGGAGAAGAQPPPGASPLSSSRETIRRAGFAAGALIALGLAAYAGAVALLYAADRPSIGGAAGVVLSILSALAWIPEDTRPLPPNGAAGWLDLFASPLRTGPRPFVLFFGGDPAEVKFFLAKYRRHVFRGLGLFLEFPGGDGGGPAASLREGFPLPHRVDPRIVARVRAAAGNGGIGEVRPLPRPFVSAGLVAMTRGFKAVTLSRLPSPSPGIQHLSDESAASWISGIVNAS